MTLGTKGLLYQIHLQPDLIRTHISTERAIDQVDLEISTSFYKNDHVDLQDMRTHNK